MRPTRNGLPRPPPKPTMLALMMTIAKAQTAVEMMYDRCARPTAGRSGEPERATQRAISAAMPQRCEGRPGGAARPEERQQDRADRGRTTVHRVDDPDRRRPCRSRRYVMATRAKANGRTALAAAAPASRPRTNTGPDVTTSPRSPVATRTSERPDEDPPPTVGIAEDPTGEQQGGAHERADEDEDLELGPGSDGRLDRREIRARRRWDSARRRPARRRRRRGCTQTRAPRQARETGRGSEGGPLGRS